MIGDGTSDFLRKANPRDSNLTARPHEMSEIVQVQVVGPVVGEALPHFRGEEKRQPAGVPEKFCFARFDDRRFCAAHAPLLPLPGGDGGECARLAAESNGIPAPGDFTEAR